MNNNIFRIENDGIAYVTEKELKSFNVPNGSINEYILQIEGLIAKKLNTDPAQIKANSVTWDFNKSRLDDNSQVLVVKYSYIDEYNTAFMDLEINQVDAVFLDNVVANYYIATNK